MENNIEGENNLKIKISQPKIRFVNFETFKNFLLSTKIGTLLSFINFADIKYRDSECNVFLLDNFKKLNILIIDEEWTIEMINKYNQLLDIINNKEKYLDRTTHRGSEWNF